MIGMKEGVGWTEGWKSSGGGSWVLRRERWSPVRCR